jgi:hypothetical protein
MTLVPETPFLTPSLCPSARCEEGAFLIAMPGPEGRAEFFGHPLVLPEELLERPKGSPAPETRLRFASPCRKGGCQQWTGTRCGVIDGVLPLLTPHADATAPLPNCGIRENCRWFRQRGTPSCMVCPLVITDLQSEEWQQSV